MPDTFVYFSDKIAEIYAAAAAISGVDMNAYAQAEARSEDRVQASDIIYTGLDDIVAEWVEEACERTGQEPSQEGIFALKTAAFAHLILDFYSSMANHDTGHLEALNPDAATEMRHAIFSGLPGEYQIED